MDTETSDTDSIGFGITGINEDNRARSDAANAQSLPYDRSINPSDHDGEHDTPDYPPLPDDDDQDSYEDMPNFASSPSPPETNNVASYQADVEDWETSRNDPSRVQPDTASRFSSSSEDDDGDENDDTNDDESDGNASHESNQSTASRERPWGAEELARIAEEASRGFLYEQRPRSPVYGTVSSGQDDDIIWLRNHPIKQNRPPPIDERRPLPPPSKLRRTKSVEDISPDGSSDVNDPLQPLQSQQPNATEIPQRVASSAVPPPASPSLYQPKSSFNWADEDGEDDEWLGSVGNDAQSRNSPSTQETPNGNDFGPIVNEAPSPPIPVQHEHPVHVEGEDADEPLPKVDGLPDGDAQPGESARPAPNHPAPASEPHGTSSSRPGSPYQSSVADDDEEEDAEQSKPQPEPSGSLNHDDDEIVPDSPTPSDASSMDSTTNKTQSQGYADAQRFESERRTDLGKQKAKLKADNPDHQHVRNIAVNPQDHIAALEAKVHVLKRDLKQEYDEFNKLVDDRNELHDHYKQIKQELVQIKQQLVNGGLQYEALNNGHNKLRAYCNNAREQNEAQRVELMKQDEKIATLEDQGLEQQERILILEADVEQAEQKLKVSLRTQEMLTAELAFAQQKLQDLQSTTSENASLANDERQRQIAETRSIGTSTEDSERATTTQSRIGGSNNTMTLPRNPMLLPANNVRWPATIREELAIHIVAWMTNNHERESSFKQPLKAEDVLNTLGNGTITFQQLVESIQQRGYKFRVDHFGRDIAGFMRDQGRCSEEAMYAEWDLAGKRIDIAVLRLLQEIDRLESEHETGRSKLYRLEIQDLEAKLRKTAVVVARELKKRKGELRDAQESSRGYSEALATVNDANNELQEQLQTITSKLQQCHEHGQKLKTEVSTLSEQLTVCHAENSALSTKNAKLIEDIRGVEAELRVVQDVLSQTRFGLDQKTRALDELTTGEQNAAADVENVRLKRKLAEVRAERDKHLEMLFKARDHIENLKTHAGETSDALDKVRRTAAGPSQQPLQQEHNVPPLPRALDTAASPTSPATTPSVQTPPHWLEREARLANSEAYLRTRAALKEKREAEAQESAELWKLRTRAYQNLCGWNEIVYVPREERLDSLRRLALV